MVFVNDVNVWGRSVKEVRYLLSYITTNVITLLVVTNSPSTAADKWLAIIIIIV